MRKLLAAGALACALLAACGGGDGSVDRAEKRQVVDLGASAVPVRINGLRVDREDITSVLEGANRPYLDATSFYSMREGDLLRATLQIGKFSSDAKYSDEDFRAKLINRIGSGTPRLFRVADHDVWLTSGDRQTLAIWFQDEYVFVLATRDDYEFGRSLLRATLEVQP